VEIVQLYGTPRFELHFPFLVNIGGNGKPGEDYSPNTVFVSRNHAERHAWTEFVWNGIDLNDYPLRPKQKGDYALFLAKASWKVKNLAGAIAISRDAGLALHVAGGRAGWWKRGVRSFGEVDGAKKLELLGGASALLFPVIWDEPFGLAVVEALATGLPVIATPRGALPEIVTPEVGVLADSHQDLVEGLRKSASFDPGACRARVETQFTHIHMAQGYEGYYKRILAQGRIREGSPMAPPDADPERRILYQGYRK
jgi:glycosyltransferase involved in cell wall biosynthesis